MSDNIFDLEQQILDCWKVTDDIDTVTAWFIDSPQWQGMDPKIEDALSNKYNAIQELYELKFNKMWETFEKVCQEYHRYRKAKELNSGRDFV